MHRDDLAAVAPGWRDISIALHGDAAVRAATGWVGEMYGFALAVCQAGLALELREQELMLHPPFDKELGTASIIHYTYGSFCLANGTTVDPAKVPKELVSWSFDKRFFERDYPTAQVPLPPAGAPPSVLRTVSAINEALAASAGEPWGAQAYLKGKQAEAAAKASVEAPATKPAEPAAKVAKPAKKAVRKAPAPKEADGETEEDGEAEEAR